ncbi:hypothetical protein [Dactylosporangium sp. NPDC051541]|uniref:hypothetical protein n=1 Tax=Dactylosporangium sp. NPDC051541 TaxID=3363977 RepID=UPI003790B442
MSNRYEWYLGSPPAWLCGPDDGLWDEAEDGNDERHWALVIGDPGSAALVIYGDPADLRAAVAQLAAAVGALPAADQVIDGDPVPRTPEPPGGRT